MRHLLWNCPMWMSLDFTDDQSRLVQVMAWCRQAPSHCLSQCWPRSLSPYGATRPQWVKYKPNWHAFITLGHYAMGYFTLHIDGLLQNCIISSVLAMEILQSSTKPLMCCRELTCHWCWGVIAITPIGQQAISRTNADILLIGYFGTHIKEFLIKIS